SFSTIRIPGIEEIEWDFGDGETGTGLEPVHAYEQGGTYTVVATITSNGAEQTATKIIDIQDGPEINTPENIHFCNNSEQTIDLTQTKEEILGDQDEEDFEFDYFNSEEDALNDESPITNPEEYPAEDDVVYVRVTNLETGCFAITSFEIKEEDPPEIDQPGDRQICENNSDHIDLTEVLDELLDGQDTDLFEITFYTSAGDAQEDNDPIEDPEDFSTTEDTTVYIRVSNIETGCFAVTSFAIILDSGPEMPDLPNLEHCDVDKLDGTFSFDLTQQDELLLAGNRSEE